MPTLTVLLRRGFCIEHQSLQKPFMLNQQEVVVEKMGLAKTIHDRTVASGGMEGKILRFVARGPMSQGACPFLLQRI